jgi:hypothetical protein
MIIVWGSRLYGKVDAVPGLFHVATRFGHIWYLPLIPMGSYLVLRQDGEHFKGVSIGLSLKSVLVAWGMTACILALIIGGIIAFVQASDHHTADAMSPGAVALAGLVGLILIFTLGGIRRATHARALALGRRIGLTAEGEQMINQIFNRPHGAGGAFPVMTKTAQAVPMPVQGFEGILPAKPVAPAEPVATTTAPVPSQEKPAAPRTASLGLGSE